MLSPSNPGDVLDNNCAVSLPEFDTGDFLNADDGRQAMQQPSIPLTSNLQFDLPPFPPPLYMDLNADDGRQAMQQPSIPLTSNLHLSTNRDDGDNLQFDLPLIPPSMDLNAGDAVVPMGVHVGMQLLGPPDNSRSTTRTRNKTTDRTQGDIVESGLENTGRWSQEEHEAFLAGYKLLGGNKWKELATKVKTRTPKQIRKHAERFFATKKGAPMKINKTLVYSVDHGMFDFTTALSAIQNYKQENNGSGNVRSSVDNKLYYRLNILWHKCDPQQQQTLKDMGYVPPVPYSVMFDEHCHLLKLFVDRKVAEGASGNDTMPNSGSNDPAEKKLAKFCINARLKRNNDKLDNAHRIRLDDIGFVWAPHKVGKRKQPAAKKTKKSATAKVDEGEMQPVQYTEAAAELKSPPEDLKSPPEEAEKGPIKKRAAKGGRRSSKKDEEQAKDGKRKRDGNDEIPIMEEMPPLPSPDTVNQSKKARKDEAVATSGTVELKALTATKKTKKSAAADADGTCLAGDGGDPTPRRRRRRNPSEKAAAAAAMAAAAAADLKERKENEVKKAAEVAAGGSDVVKQEEEDEAGEEEGNHDAPTAPQSSSTIVGVLKGGAVLGPISEEELKTLGSGDDEDIPAAKRAAMASALALRAAAGGSPVPPPKSSSEVDFDVANPPESPVILPSELPVLESTTLMAENDVLCGRGVGTNSQMGNRHFRALVRDFQPTYLMAKRREKPKMARSVVVIIRNRGGRFLRRDDKTGRLYEVGDEKAEAKTSQALREGLDVRATRTAADTLMGTKKKKKKRKNNVPPAVSNHAPPPPPTGNSPTTTSTTARRLPLNKYRTGADRRSDTNPPAEDTVAAQPAQEPQKVYYGQNFGWFEPI